MRLSIAALAGLAASGLAQTYIPEMELAPPYLNHEFHNQNYEIGGSALLSRSTCKLTSDLPDQRGWLLATRRGLPENFQIDIEFLIDGDGKHMFGDGMAVWFLQDDQVIGEGPVFGLQDYFKGTALYIDTYRNHRPGKAFPYLVLTQNDGTQRYDADNDGKANEIAGYSARGLHSPAQQPSRLRINYDAGGLFTVEINYKNKWETAISQALDIGLGRRLALSASTGQLSENHIIRKIHVWETDPLSPAEKQKYQNQKNQQDGGKASNFAQNDKKKSGTWLWFFFKLIMVGSAVFGCYQVYISYKKNKNLDSSLGYI